MMFTIQDIAEAQDLVHDLEILQEALPMLIFMVKMGLAVGRREFREAGLGTILDQEVPMETAVAPQNV